MVMNEQESWKNKEHPSVGRRGGHSCVSTDLNGALERSEVGRTALGEEVAWCGVWEPDWVRGLCVQGGSAWEVVALRTSGEGVFQQGPGCWSPGVVGEASTWRRGLWQQSRDCLPTEGINQRVLSHIKGSGNRFLPITEEKTKQVQGCWTGTESISVNIWLSIYIKVDKEIQIDLNIQMNTHI